VVNVNPFEPKEAMVEVPLAHLGMAPDASFVVRDLLTQTEYTWRGATNYVKLTPSESVGHLFEIVVS
jgi:starch synthase (maltosyl-transferring)